jgi:c(7)-type cytochrome triheme protein
MCSITEGTRTAKYRIIIPVLLYITLAGSLAFAQIFIPGVPPESDYGKIILNNHTSQGGPGAVVFDHWLHRSKFTCRLCHVDIGFAMAAKATGIKAESNQQGFHCGACHDGKRIINGKIIFPSCSTEPSADRAQCNRCHSLGKKGVRQYQYESFVAKFPKEVYGIAWERAESDGTIKPIDALEGLSIQKPALKNHSKLGIRPQAALFSNVYFSHEKHSIWNGCEVCHPDIFPTAKQGAVEYSMHQIAQGRKCGACHGTVAFPINGCQWCHPRGVTWFPGPSHFP